MKNKIRPVVMGLLLAVFAVSTLLTLRQWQQNAAAETAYREALTLALQEAPETVPESVPAATAAPSQSSSEAAAPVWVPVPVTEDPAAQELEKINLAALRQENPDVVGWLRIPETGIDYPLLQGTDNDFYLNHNWKKEPNSAGAVFLEHQNDPALTDYNTIVYGHNMNNGSMFADLELFALKSFHQAHPYVYILSDAGVYRYEIFVFSQVEVDSLVYGMNPRQEDTKAYFLTLAAETAPFDTGIRPALTDRILTLSTCSGTNYDYRYIVQARLPMMELPP